VRRRRSLHLLLALPLVPACARRIPADATRTVVSLQDIDCESCGTRVVAAAKRNEGVYAAEFDRRTAEVAFRHDAARISAEELLALARAQDVSAVLGPGKGRYLPPATYPPQADVRSVADAGVELDSLLAPGKVTVFDFWAAWCQPCRRVDEHLVAILRTRDDVAVRKLDIVDWDSALARRHLAGVEQLPYVVVYGRDGRRRAAISGLDLEALDRAIEDGAR
jgi:thiol-disulfide isomerase/thioredoxin